MATPHDNKGIEEILDNEGTTTGAIILGALMTTATHPLTCVRVLMQVGHEPIAPTPSRTLFGTKVLRLPSFFQYANHIKKVEGWRGLYRGLLPRVYSSMVGTFLNSTILQTVSKQKTPLMKISVQENKTSREELVEFTKETCVQAAGKVTALVISHPLYVVSIRMMVQFVGKETIYSGLRASFKEIYENEGIAGFFSGIIPRILGEVLSLVFFRGACFLVSRYAVDSEVSRRKEVQIYTNGLFQYVAGVVTYPFVLVTHMMIVNHVGLAAGEVPAMPAFSGWTDCFAYLRKTGNLWRGSSMFRRTVSGH